MSFETRNIEVVLYNLLKNVQCTLIMKPSYTWQIQYFKHQQNDQWETSSSSCENIKPMYYFKCYNCTTLELLNHHILNRKILTNLSCYTKICFFCYETKPIHYVQRTVHQMERKHVFSMEHKHIFGRNYLKIIFFVAQIA